MSWTDLRDSILVEIMYNFVIYNWNGIPSDNSGKKEVYYLGNKTRELNGKEFTLCVSFIDLAKQFKNLEDAEEFTRLQNELRPRPLGDGWVIDTVANVTIKTGGPCATHGALFGRNDLEKETEAQFTP
jgi:hypothetical protein